MTVLDSTRKVAIDVNIAKCEGRKLVFITYSKKLQTNDYIDEQVCYQKLYELVSLGYIVVDELFQYSSDEVIL